jgi:hypothetical protein
MFNSGFHSPTQLVGLAQIAQDEEFKALGAAHLPAGGLRQAIAHALTWLRQTYRAQHPATRGDLQRLTRVNQALELRVVALERQLAAVPPPLP